MVLELFTAKVCVLFYQLLLVVTLISSVPKGVGSAVQLWGHVASMFPDDLVNMKGGTTGKDDSGYKPRRL